MTQTKKQFRKTWRTKVFQRDKWTCQVCGAHGYDAEDTSWTTSGVPLDAHHITPREWCPFGGYVLKNGITVCRNKCHIAVENAPIRSELGPYALYLKIGTTMWFAFEEMREMAEKEPRIPKTSRERTQTP